jgi:hypothetical protein
MKRSLIVTLLAQQPWCQGRARGRPVRLLLALLIVTLSQPARANACDVCAIYTATEQRWSQTGVRIGVAEQYTDYQTLQESGHEVPNPDGQRLNSSITQFLLGYNFTPRIGVQLNVPVIARYYRRPQGTGIVDGNVSGFGDLSLLGNVAAYSRVTANSVARLTLLGGLKLPSGNPSRLSEELSEGDESTTAALRRLGARPLHTETSSEDEVASGIHGHDLALGSGSVDGIVGALVFGSWRRVFATGGVQYALRKHGAFGYQYANDLTWAGGPGVFVLLSHTYTLGLQVLLTGETKGNDNLNGVKATDTAITALYVGPGLTYTWGTSLGAEVAVDLPTIQHNSALQIVPNVRLRGGLTWRF